ncbi:MAG: hypothetical protein FD174_4104 [Geobacteraceae bacterium]|nr:MAG: hypothetical protein FD174_4104 [Geobacteraceae bacterium]
MTSYRILRHITCLIALLLIAGCGGGGAGSASPASIVLTADKTSAVANGTDSINLAAEVRDGTGAPVAGVPVTINLSDGSHLPGSTDGEGRVAFILSRPLLTVATGDTVTVAAECAGIVSNRLEVSFLPPPAGANKVTISPEGDGVFTLQGIDFKDVAGIKVTISYDSATLANPRVEKGGLIAGAMMVSNTTAPGRVVIAAVSTKPLSGSGPIATIYFDRTGTEAGRILSVTVELTDIRLNSAPADVAIPDSATSSTAPAQTGGSQPVSTTSSSPGTPVGTNP